MYWPHMTRPNQWSPLVPCAPFPCNFKTCPIFSAQLLSEEFLWFLMMNSIKPVGNLKTIQKVLQNQHLDRCSEASIETGINVMLVG